MKNSIQKLYSVLDSGWYDPFKKFWNFCISRKVNVDFESFLKKHLDDSKDVLDLGCGTALNLQKISKLKLSFKSYLGLDFTSSMLDIAKGKFPYASNVEFRKKDIEKLDDLDKKYDVIVCTWVLSHLKDPVEFVNNAQKHLKPGGVFFLVFYTRPDWFLNFWLNPIAKHLFYAKSFEQETLSKFDNVYETKSYTANLVTAVKIKRST